MERITSCLLAFVFFVLCFSRALSGWEDGDRTRPRRGIRGYKPRFRKDTREWVSCDTPGCLVPCSGPEDNRIRLICATESSITVTWEAQWYSGFEKSYEVQVVDVLSNRKVFGKDVKSKSFKATGLASNHSYRFRIRCMGSVDLPRSGKVFWTKERKPRSNHSKHSDSYRHIRRALEIAVSVGGFVVIAAGIILYIARHHGNCANDVRRQNKNRSRNLGNLNKTFVIDEIDFTARNGYAKNVMIPKHLNDVSSSGQNRYSVTIKEKTFHCKEHELSLTNPYEVSKRRQSRELRFYQHRLPSIPDVPELEEEGIGEAEAELVEKEETGYKASEDTK